MQRTDAQTLVKSLFQSAFDTQRYGSFVRELTNGNITPPKTGHMSVPDAFAEHIKSCTRLGTYKNDRGELVDILVVQVQSSFKIDRTRTALRNFVAHKLKRGEGDENNYKEAALVAFVAPNAAEWRFSFVRMEYATIRDPQTGKYKTEEQLTPARRYTYLVGPAEQSHTAQSRFIDLLVGRGQPSVDDLMGAFSVEKVTSEFFDAYKKLFLGLLTELNRLCAADEALAAEFARAQINHADFCKKTLGQIVFLYFLQKKGWLGVARGAAWGSGPTDFMRSLANRAAAQQRSLFNDILEPLFYDTLAIDRKGTQDWSDALECRIPFLNGGLFEPYLGYDWKKTEITFANALFTNAAQTGILDVFDRYNFTVDEAEPLETDVAIDPEMLGKVFENLLDVDDRAATGAFYTPREIVHYMCQLSLVHYLQRSMTDLQLPVTQADIEALVYRGDQAAEYERARLNGTISYSAQLPASIQNHAKVLDTALANITVLDPAIGSGAFPVGMMNEIVRVRSVLSAYFSDYHARTVYEFKRHAIQASLYGVDIAAGAVEIAKLRLWLSLVVDEDDESRIKPLPNLDFKIVVGNSLLDATQNVFNHYEYADLNEAKKAFFDETDHQRKELLRTKIKAIIARLMTDSAQFDFQIYFNEVYDRAGNVPGGFDVVIGNPPYVQIQEFKGQKVHQAYRNAGYESFDSNGDLYCLFYEQGIRQLRSGGSLCFITSNKWLRTAYGKNLRRVLYEQNPMLLIDLGRWVFNSATVDSNILQVVKENNLHALHALKMRVKLSGNFYQQVVQNTFHFTPEQDEPWFIDTPKERALKEKIFSKSRILKNWDVRINYGIKTGLNQAFIINDEIRNNLLDNEPILSEIIKPLVRGRDINKFNIGKDTLWLIFIPWHFPLHQNTRNHLTQNSSEEAFKIQYPYLYNYMLQHKHKLSNRNANEVGIRYEWYALQRCAASYYQEFEREKIIWKNIGQILRFAYDKDGYYPQNSTCIMTGSNLKYLVAFLNSNLARFFLESDNVNVSVQALEPLPVALITPANQPLVTAIEAHVERILAAKKADAQADTRVDEAAIDQLVYQLYDLTPDEIALIEAAQPAGVGTAALDDEE